MQVHPLSPSHPFTSAPHKLKDSNDPNSPPSSLCLQPTFNPDSSLMWRDIVILNRYAGVVAAAGQGGWKIGDVVALRSVPFPLSLPLSH